VNFLNVLVHLLTVAIEDYMSLSLLQTLVVKRKSLGLCIIFALIGCPTGGKIYI